MAQVLFSVAFVSFPTYLALNQTDSEYDRLLPGKFGTHLHSAHLPDPLSSLDTTVMDARVEMQELVSKRQTEEVSVSLLPDSSYYIFFSDILGLESD